MMKTGNNREKKEKKSSKSRLIVGLGILYNATHKTDRHDITEILKVALNTINQPTHH